MFSDGIKYGSDSALEVGPSPSATPKKALFKPPAAPVQVRIYIYIFLQNQYCVTCINL